jgi:glucose-1-phosphate thymidylyltransferase
MKIILPVAGKGTRLRPHTFSRAKSLVPVAGKTVLEHIINNLLILHNIEEFIFIIDENGGQIEKFIKEKYPNLQCKYIVQKERKGPAHAVWLAKDEVGESDILIVFNDTIFIADLTKIDSLCNGLDGLIYSKEVEDYQRFGVNVVKDGIIIDMVEKPDKPVSRLAQVGLYYIKNGKILMDAITESIEKNMVVKGEFYLPESFKIMIKNGAKLGAPTIDEWLDCGTRESLLSTNKYLLEKFNNNFCSKCINSIIVPPVFIDSGVEIENSVIGPYASVGKNSKIKNAIINNSIINSNTFIERIILSNSLIGENVNVKGRKNSLDIGDNSIVML